MQEQDISYTVEGSGNWVAEQQPTGGDSLSSADHMTITLAEQTVTDTTDIPENYSVIPDVDGLSMRKATQLITGRGFKIKMIGSGTVYTQFPRAGDPMKKGRTITVRGKSKALNTLVSK